MDMTYEGLAKAIAEMTPEQRQCNVTVYMPDVEEFYPVGSVDTPDTDVLDPNHPVLILVGF